MSEPRIPLDGAAAAAVPPPPAATVPAEGLNIRIAEVPPTQRLRELETVLRRREATLEAVGFAATRFLGGTDWEVGVVEVLARLGRATEVSRVYLVEIFYDSGGVLRASYRFEWDAPGVSPQLESPELQNVALEAAGFGAWRDILFDGGMIHGPLAGFPAPAQALFAPRQIRSLAMVPVFVGSECWGFLGFDDCLSEREWSTSELQTLEIAAATLGAALHRQRDERRLAAQYAVTRILSDPPAAGEVARELIRVICEHLRWDAGTLWTVDEQAQLLRCSQSWHAANARTERFEGCSREIAFAPGEGLPGRVWQRGEPAWITDVTLDDNFPRAASARAEGLHGAFAFPITSGSRILGVMEFFSTEVRPSDGDLLRSMAVIGSEIGQFAERQRIEASLREGELRKTAIVDAALDCIVMIDQEGRITEFNPAAERTFGYARAEVLGQPMAELIIPPALRADHQAGIARHLADGSSRLLGQRIEITGMRADGSEFPVELTIIRLPLEGPATFTGFLRDITERKAAEAQARELMFEQAARAEAEAAERRAHFLAEASRVLGTSFDYHTTLATLARLAVPQLADFCTVDMLEAERKISRVAFAHADPRKESLLRRGITLGERPLARSQLVVTVLGEGRPVLIEEVSDDLLREYARDEVQYAALQRLAPRSLISVPLIASERVLGALTLVYSDSGRRYTHQELALAQELGRRASLAVENARLFRATEQATRARDEVLAVVAHDLRNPLNTILLSAQLLLEDSIPLSTLPEEHRRIAAMRRAAERMNRLIHDLLDVNRIGSGRLALDLQPEAVETVLADAFEMLRPLAAARSLELVREAPERLPPILADHGRVLQVLSNLVGNALKFTPAGGRITLRVEAAAGEVRFAVIDTGPGIPPEQLSHIFGRFWQANQSDRRGIGLGLAIAQGIIEAHGGRIWAESQLGRGSTFWFTVPIFPARTDSRENTGR